MLWGSVLSQTKVLSVLQPVLLSSVICLPLGVPMSLLMFCEVMEPLKMFSSGSVHSFLQAVKMWSLRLFSR